MLLTSITRRRFDARTIIAARGQAHNSPTRSRVATNPSGCALLEILSDALGLAAVIIVAIVSALTGWTSGTSVVATLSGVLILPEPSHFATGLPILTAHVVVDSP